MKRQYTKLLLLSILLLLKFTGFAQKVSNVHFEQVGKEIHIYYDLEAFQPFIIKVYCSTDGGETWGTPLKYLKGDKGMGQVSGKKKIIWDVISEKVDLEGNINFKIDVLKQEYTGVIPLIDNFEGDNFFEYTAKMLIEDEDLEMDSHGIWYSDNEIHYGIITGANWDNNIVDIDILFIRTDNDFFRSADGENWRAHINYESFNKKKNISLEYKNGLKELLIPGRCIEFSIVEGAPETGNSLAGYWTISYLKGLCKEVFSIDTCLLFNKEYFGNSNPMQESKILESHLKRIDYLFEMDGKYPSEVFFFNDVIIETRLKQILGDRYPMLIEKCVLQVPIQIKNNSFIVEGCQQHNCKQTNFIIAVDLMENIMFVGIRDDGQITTYNEANVELPEAIIEWMNLNN